MLKQNFTYLISCLLVQLVLGASLPVKNDELKVLNFNVNAKDLIDGENIFKTGFKSSETLLCKAPARKLNEKFSNNFQKSVEESSGSVFALINVVGEDNKSVQIPVLVLKQNDQTPWEFPFTFIGNMIQAMQNANKPPVNPNSNDEAATSDSGTPPFNLDFFSGFLASMREQLNNMGTSFTNSLNSIQSQMMSMMGVSQNSVSGAAPSGNTLLADMFNSLNMTTSTTVKEPSTTTVQDKSVVSTEPTPVKVEVVNDEAINDSKPVMLTESDKIPVVVVMHTEKPVVIVSEMISTLNSKDVSVTEKVLTEKEPIKPVVSVEVVKPSEHVTVVATPEIPVQETSINPIIKPVIVEPIKLESDIPLDDKKGTTIVVPVTPDIVESMPVVVIETSEEPIVQTVSINEAETKPPVIVVPSE